MTLDARAFLRRLFDAAVKAADPLICVPPNLPRPPQGRTVVVGAGKAAAAMASAVERNWPGQVSGLVVTRYGHGVPCERIEVVEAAHPIPDAAGRDAAARILAAVGGLSDKDLVLVLVSGGASALLALPAPGISLEDKQAVNRALLKSGASIDEMNSVRKHLSGIKGGRLALAAHPAQVVALVISDVPGDDPAVVGSGPTVADPTTCADALRILEKYGIEAPATIRELLESGRGESPKPDDTRFSVVETRVIATARRSLAAAEAVAHSAGMRTLVLGDMIEGEAREVARALAGVAKSCAMNGLPLAPPCVILSGGETTVTVRGAGRGGRNSEFLLGFALALQGQRGIHGLACDTDGIDGSEDNAGALYADDTWRRGMQAGLDAHGLLARNDAYGYFAALGELVVTGPTRTNVNDFRAVLVLP